jgi:hypothetical protein
MWDWCRRTSSRSFVRGSQTVRRAFARECMGLRSSTLVRPGVTGSSFAANAIGPCSTPPTPTPVGAATKAFRHDLRTWPMPPRARRRARHATSSLRDRSAAERATGVQGGPIRREIAASFRGMHLPRRTLRMPRRARPAWREWRAVRATRLPFLAPLKALTRTAPSRFGSTTKKRGGKRSSIPKTSAAPGPAIPARGGDPLQRGRAWRRRPWGVATAMHRPPRRTTKAHARTATAKRTARAQALRSPRCTGTEKSISAMAAENAARATVAATTLGRRVARTRSMPNPKVHAGSPAKRAIPFRAQGTVIPWGESPWSPSQDWPRRVDGVQRGTPQRRPVRGPTATKGPVERPPRPAGPTELPRVRAEPATRSLRPRHMPQAPRVRRWAAT